MKASVQSIKVIESCRRGWHISFPVLNEIKKITGSQWKITKKLRVKGQIYDENFRQTDKLILMLILFYVFFNQPKLRACL